MSQFDDIIAQRLAVTQESSGNSDGVSPVDRQRFFMWLSIGLGAVIVTFIILVLVLHFGGRLFIVFKEPDAKYFTRPAVCDELVNEYVEAMNKELFDSPEMMRSLARKVPSNDMAIEDANCQFIKLYTAYIDHNFEQALEIARGLSSLLDKGSYVDIRLPLLGNINEIIRSIEIQKQFFDNPDNFGS